MNQQLLLRLVVDWFLFGLEEFVVFAGRHMVLDGLLLDVVVGVGVVLVVMISSGGLEERKQHQNTTNFRKDNEPQQQDVAMRLAEDSSVVDRDIGSFGSVSDALFPWGAINPDPLFVACGAGTDPDWCVRLDVLGEDLQITWFRKNGQVAAMFLTKLLGSMPGHGGGDVEA